MTQELLQILNSLPKPQPQGDPRTLNAYRHGLTGQVRFCTPADEQAYKKHCAGYMEDFAPKGAVETDLTQSVADGRPPRQVRRQSRKVRQSPSPRSDGTKPIPHSTPTRTSQLAQTNRVNSLGALKTTAQHDNLKPAQSQKGFLGVSASRR
jgi:hypothetical protein